VLFIARYILKSEKRQRGGWDYYFIFFSLCSHCQILVSCQNMHDASATSVTLFIKINYMSLKNLAFILLQNHNLSFLENTYGSLFFVLTKHYTSELLWNSDPPHSSLPPALCSESKSRLSLFVAGPRFPICFRHRIVELKCRAWK